MNMFQVQTRRHYVEIAMRYHKEADQDKVEKMTPP